MNCPQAAGSLAPPNLSQSYKKAQTQNWALIFSDQASFREVSTLYATWSRVGQPPKIPVTGQRKSVKSLGAIELFQTRFHYRQETVFNASTYLGFLGQLAASIGGKAQS